MRRPQLYVGVILVLFGFWVGGLFTHLDNQEVLGPRNQESGEDDEFDTDFDAYEEVLRDMVDEHGPNWREMQMQVAGALKEMEGETIQKGGSTKESLGVTYTALDIEETSPQPRVSQPSLDVDDEGEEDVEEREVETEEEVEEDEGEEDAAR
jgi:hypothetical protein